MNLRLIRSSLTLKTTIGELYVDGKYECFICEDRYRPPPAVKVPRETCIPLGRYEIIINRSERFSKLAGRDVFMPLLLEVPQFTGIRIHPGNGPEDTEGCLLPGLSKLTDAVYQSTAAYQALFGKLKACTARNERMWIDIELAPGAVAA